MICWHIKKKKRKERFQRRVTSAKLIQTKWFTYVVKKQNEAATKISTGWRRHFDKKKYKRVIRGAFILLILFEMRFSLTFIIAGVILCQSVLRKLSAKTRAHLLRCSRRVEASTTIQARWRSFAASKRFRSTRQIIMLLQSIHRRKMAEKFLQDHTIAATKICRTWRSHYSQMSYARKMKGMSSELDTCCMIDLTCPN